MQKITFMAFKGGAGKSTALFLMTSVLNKRGIRVGIIDADENKSVIKWQSHARAIGAWDEENIKVYDGWGEDRFEEAFEQAERDDPDYLLIDTKGGGSDLNQTAALNSDLIVIPTDLGTGEIDIALETMEYVMKLLASAEMDIPTAFLLNRVPTDDNEAHRGRPGRHEDLRRPAGVRAADPAEQVLQGNGRERSPQSLRGLPQGPRQTNNAGQGASDAALADRSRAGGGRDPRRSPRAGACVMALKKLPKDMSYEAVRYKHPATPNHATPPTSPEDRRAKTTPSRHPVRRRRTAAKPGR